MKKKLLSILTAALLLISCCSVAFATPVDEGIQPYETSSVVFGVSRTTATTANVSISVNFSQKVDQYSVVVYLQKLSNGSWVLDTTNDDYVYYNNGFNSRTFNFSKKYDDLERGVSYRIQCVSKDYIGSSSHTMTSYSKLF